MWLGLVKSGDEWIWEDGNIYSYRNWAPGEPDSDSDCAFIASNGKWFSKNCDDEDLPVLCELLLI